MKLSVETIDNKSAGTAELKDSIFAVPFRQDIIARMIAWQLAKRQSGTHQTKTISMISGTTRKPFRQKGTGNARQGSLRSPQFRGGATIFGPQSRSHAHKLTKKFRNLALRTALSQKCRADDFHLFDSLALNSNKTSAFKATFARFLTEKTLVVDLKPSALELRKSGGNIPNVNILPVEGLNVYDLVKHRHLVISKEALLQLEEKLNV